METIQRFTAALSKPLNILITSGSADYTRATLDDIGVARISIGTSLARVTHRAIYDISKSMIESGDFTVLANSIESDVSDPFLSDKP
ncbi:isocitrate lyase/phosphoenolpyruvate mutase family protein [Cognatiyoonia sp.]|uniref:isocitrate lyase/phosphoenolpyruvate mutase family protein n=1 Tax=Cognatiyoonia sp. TaxID=2211652 RepID=UPI003F69DB46